MIASTTYLRVNISADIPTRVCKMNYFESGFDGPQLLSTGTDVSLTQVKA